MTSFVTWLLSGSEYISSYISCPSLMIYAVNPYTVIFMMVFVNQQSAVNEKHSLFVSWFVFSA